MRDFLFAVASAGVNVEAIYSDHGRQQILIVDNMTKGQEVSEAWTRENLDPAGKTQR